MRQCAVAACGDDQPLDLCDGVGNVPGNALAKVIQLRAAALVLERNDEDAVAIKQGRGDPSPGWIDLARPEDGYITTLGEFEDEFIVLPFFELIAGEACSQPTGLNADDGVAARIEVCAFVKDLFANRELFKLIAAAGKRLRHDETKEALEAIDPFETLAVEDAVELLLELLICDVGKAGHNRQPS